MARIKILLADPHAMVREAVRTQLEVERDFVVIGEAANTSKTTDLIKKLSPDIIILDLELQGFFSFDFFPQLSRYFPATRVVILSALCTTSHVIAALQNRASGYVFKSSSYETLAEAIRTVAAGGIYVPVSLSKSDLRTCIKRKNRAALDQSRNLTLRQQEVLDLAAEGFTNSEIASRLYISRRTVEAHRARLMHKLALNDRAALIRYAYKMRGIQLGGYNQVSSTAKSNTQ